MRRRYTESPAQQLAFVFTARGAGVTPKKWVRVKLTQKSEEFYGVQPEKKLLIAIIQQAILDAVADDRAVRLDAEAWFRDVSHEVFGFGYCCDHLDYLPEIIIKKLKETRKKKGLCD